MRLAPTYALSAADMASPLWLKIGYGAAIAVIVPVYWDGYGPQNFLWLSDIALFLTACAVIFERRLPAGMAAVAVLPLELGWALDFLTGGYLLGIAAYMFDPKLPLHLRGLSLFHLALPPTLLWIIYRCGYDTRAFALQLPVTLTALALSYVAADPHKNVNWVFGPGSEPQTLLPSPVYFALVMILIPLLAMLPTHLLLRRFFTSRNDPPGPRKRAGAD